MDEAIARHALAYVQNGSTLQTGIGAIPNIVATELAKGPLGGFGIHSEMFTTGLMRLHQAGKVTNDAKGVFDGVSVTTFALGTSRSSTEWLDGNDEVAFLPVETVNDPTVIARNANLVSINGALSVDLYGQVMADSIDGRQISGVGGHEDFVAGAELHLDAHSLICLRSTAVREGEVVSRIVGLLPEGSVVSTPRHHTGVVITEYGAAELTGLHGARARPSAGRHRAPRLPRGPAQGGRRARTILNAPPRRGRARLRVVYPPRAARCYATSLRVRSVTAERRSVGDDAVDEAADMAEDLPAVVGPGHQDLEDVEHPLELPGVGGHTGRAEALDVASDGVAEHLVAAPGDAGRREPAQVRAQRRNGCCWWRRCRGGMPPSGCSTAGCRGRRSP